MSDGSKGTRVKMVAAVVVAILLIGALGVIFTAGLSSAKPLKPIWLDEAERYGRDEVTQLDEDSNNIYASAKGIAFDGQELFTVRAYDGVTGHAIWNNSLDLGAGENIATAVDAEGPNVAAAGQGTYPNGTSVIMVAIFSTGNGSQIWNRTFSIGGDEAEATGVVLHNSMLYVSGRARTSAGVDELVVLGYAVADGTLLWMKAVNHGGGENVASAITASSDMAFVTGMIENSAGTKYMYVAALRSLDGSIAWQDIYDAGEGNNKGIGIAIAGTTVIASGLCKVDGASVMVLRAYNTALGVKMWTKQETRASVSDHMAVSGGNLIISGVLGRTYFVQSLDVVNGHSNWRTAFPNMGLFNFRTAVDVEGGLVCAAFFDQNVTEEADYTWNIGLYQLKMADGSKVSSSTTTGPGSSDQKTDIIIHGDKVFFSTSTDKPLTIGPLLLGAAAPSVVTIDGFNISVDGERFLFKGINYSPTPIGGNPDWDPNGDWFQEYWSAIPERDLPLIKSMGVNVVKVYGMTGFTWGDDPLKTKKSHETFYEALEKENLKLVVAVSTDLKHLTTYQSSDWSGNTAELTSQWKTVIAEIKSSPAASRSVIGYVVTNEINQKEQRGDKGFYGKINDIMGHIKQMSPGKFTTIGIQDFSDNRGNTFDVVEMNSTMTNLDVWGINCYRGDVGQGFAELFQMYRDNNINKPLLVTEFGVPETYHDPNTDYGEVKTYTGDGVYRYIDSHWRGHPNSIMNNTDICSGGFLFEFSDEWWKQGPTPNHQTYVWKQDPSPGTNHPVWQRPTGWEDSEGWGFFSISVADGRDPQHPDPGKPDVLTARATVAYIGPMFNSSFYPT